MQSWKGGSGHPRISQKSRKKLGQPYDAAWAQWREAEALLASGAPRAQAEATLRAAHAAAVRLGAAPLRHELELLAQRGRVRLEAVTEPSPATAQAPSVAASLGLTAREAEVLVLVAAGRTNRHDLPALGCSTPRPVLRRQIWEGDPRPSKS